MRRPSLTHSSIGQVEILQIKPNSSDQVLLLSRQSPLHQRRQEQRKPTRRIVASSRPLHHAKIRPHKRQRQIQPSRPNSLTRAILVADYDLISRWPRRPSIAPNRTKHTNRDRRPRHPRPRFHPTLARATPLSKPPLRLHDLPRSVHDGRNEHYGPQRGVFGLLAASGPVFSRPAFMHGRV